MPDAAITTDIIVGFPGETEADFQQTLEVVRESRFSGAFTFLYSKRPGTPAADMPDQLPHEVVQERYERLVEVVNEIAWSENQTFEGREVEVLVAEGEGRKDLATERLSGRARDNRLVHFAATGRWHGRPPGRHGDRHCHLRRTAPPRGRRAAELGPAHPSRRCLGGAHCRAQDRGRLAGAADDRRPCASWSRVELPAA